MPVKINEREEEPPAMITSSLQAAKRAKILVVGQFEN